MKKFHDTIGNLSRELPAYSAVPQTTAPQRAPNLKGANRNNHLVKLSMSLTLSANNTKPDYRKGHFIQL